MTLSWQTVLAIGTGGFLGAISRVYIVHLSNKHFAYDFPVGILLVNIMGSFLIGALFALFNVYTIGDSVKSFLTAGFLGALTTYSTFAIESFFLLETSLFLGLSNMFLNLLGTVLAAGIGYKLLHFFIK